MAPPTADTAKAGGRASQRCSGGGRMVALVDGASLESVESAFAGAFVVESSSSRVDARRCGLRAARRELERAAETRGRALAGNRAIASASAKGFESA